MTSLVVNAQNPTTDLSPDARAVSDHVQSDAFLFGVEKGWWRLVASAFPDIDIAISAAERTGAPSAYVFRFECSRYPFQAPLGLLWDVGKNAPGTARPTGGGNVGIVFRTNWLGRHLYTPFDRFALENHVRWPDEYPRLVWRSTFTLSLYLKHLYDLLNSRDYTGMVAF